MFVGISTVILGQKLGAGDAASFSNYFGRSLSHFFCCISYSNVSHLYVPSTCNPLLTASQITTLALLHLNPNGCLGELAALMRYQLPFEPTSSRVS